MSGIWERIKKNGLWQFIKYSIVGLSNTLISEVVYVILIYFKMHYAPASFIGFSVSTVNAYYWNQKYVFTQEKKDLKSHLSTFCRTYVAYLGSYLLSLFLLFLWIDVLHISNWMVPFANWFGAHGLQKFDNEFLGQALAAFLNLTITVPLNFFVNKYWAFREKRKPRS